MAIPTIDTTQSVLGFLQYATFAFQPGAFENGAAITAWAAVGLPAGVTINASTGLVSGSVAVPGIYVFGVKCTNSSGTSTEVKFTLGIEDSSGVSLDASVDIGIDVATGIISGPGADAYVFAAKFNDTKMLHIRFYKGAIRIKPDLTGLKFSIKEFESDAALASAEVFESINSGEYYKLPVTFAGDPLKAALTNYEGDHKTAFRPGIEFEWKQSVDFSGSAKDLVDSTQSARMLLERDFIVNT